MIHSLPLYYCDGFRPVRAESMDDAAKIFATRLAIRLYGKSGQVRTLRFDARNGAGTKGTFESYIGRPVQGGATSGHNEWLYVSGA